MTDQPAQHGREQVTCSCGHTDYDPPLPCIYTAAHDQESGEELCDLCEDHHPLKGTTCQPARWMGQENGGDEAICDCGCGGIVVPPEELAALTQRTEAAEQEVKRLLGALEFEEHNQTRLMTTIEDHKIENQRLRGVVEAAREVALDGHFDYCTNSVEGMRGECKCGQTDLIAALAALDSTATGI